jgi:hypothetical protein
LIATASAGQDFKAAESQIVRLPPAAFPTLPKAIVHVLERRGCTIPQPVPSNKPTNVVRGQFARRGQMDWAVLCSVKDASTILVFWNGSPMNPSEIARAEDRNYLQGLGGDKIGFSRGISAVEKDFIAEHYQVYGGPKPPTLEHEGINDAFIGKASVVQYFYDGKWLPLTGSD